jgi:hypothetical protein
LTFASSGPILLAFASSGPFLLGFVSSVLFFWPLYYPSFSFGLCIICPFLFTFVSSVLFFKRKGTEDTKAKRKGQMMQRQKEKNR